MFIRPFAGLITIFVWIVGAASGTQALAASQSQYLMKSEELRHAERWLVVSEALFGDREILDGSDIIEIKAPKVPKNPALVPVSLRALIPQTSERYIKRITLLVDHNPAPLAAVFHLTQRSGEAHLKTRVRVAEFSDISVVAETNDEQLYVVKHFVRASGGCDAPPRFDPDKLLSTLGKMKLQLPGGAKLGQSSPADLQITHPNFNGMQVGSGNGTYIPARLVQKIEVSFADEPLLQIDGHMSLSEDPRFRFYYKPDREGDFDIKVLDTDNTEFEQSWSVEVKKPEEQSS